MTRMLAIVAVAALGSATGLAAQVPDGAAADHLACSAAAMGDADAWRTDTARWSTPTSPAAVHDLKGTLVVGASGSALCFRSTSGRGFTIPFERIRALHYEEAHHPARLFRQSNFFITIHYVDANGRSAVETLRWLARGAATEATEVIARSTGQPFDRGLEGRSFLGVPIRTDAGDSVVVTDVDGTAVKGKLSELSPESIALIDRQGIAHEYAADDVRRIRRSFAAGPYAREGFVTGAAFGVLSVWLAAGLGGCYSSTPHDDCHVPAVMALTAGALGGLGSAIGVTIGALRYPINADFDVYRASATPRSASPAVSVAPRVAPRASAVLVSFRF